LVFIILYIIKSYFMCGILAFYNSKNMDLYQKLFDALVILQNRGRDSLGIYLYNDEYNNKMLKRFGKIKSIFDYNFIKQLGNVNHKFVFAHNRYITYKQNNYNEDDYKKWNATLNDPIIQTKRKIEIINNGSGINIYNDTQPIVKEYNNKPVVLLHNGNIKIASKLKTIIDYDNNVSDSDVLLQYIIYLLENVCKNNIIEAIKKVITTIDGAYSVVLFYNESMYLFRDSLGMRPLTIGKHKKYDSYCVCTESAVFEKIDYEFEQEVDAGEIIQVNNQITSYGTYYFKNQIMTTRSCAFEYVYLLNSNSIFNNIRVGDARYNFGKKLWDKETVDFKKYISLYHDDFVVAHIPNTAYLSAKAYAKVSGLPLQNIVQIKEKMGRTFIISNEKDRYKSLINKFIISCDTTKTKLILIDDSIVRGNTLAVVLSLLKQSCQFDEIHVRSSSPSIKYEDYMGIDIPTKEELIANYKLKANADTGYNIIIFKRKSIGLDFNENVDYYNQMFLKIVENKEYKIYKAGCNFKYYWIIYTAEMTTPTYMETDNYKLYRLLNKYSKYYLTYYDNSLYDIVDVLLNKVSSSPQTTFITDKQTNEQDIAGMFYVNTLRYLNVHDFLDVLNKLTNPCIEYNNEVGSFGVKLPIINNCKKGWCVSWHNNDYPIQFENKWNLTLEKSHQKEM
jgi:amidophosphoribosyltransferase